MANKKITLKNKAGEKLYPSTIMEQVVGINEALDGKLGKTEKAASASSADVANAVIDGSISTSKIATAAITPAKIQTSIALNGTPSMTVEPTTSSPDKTIASVGLVKEAVDGIEIGGTNLLRYLKDDGSSYWVAAASVVTINGDVIKGQSVGYGYPRISNISMGDVSWEANTRYVLSFWVRGEGGYDGSVTISSDSVVLMQKSVGIYTSTWKRYVITFTTAATLPIVSNMKLYFYCGNVLSSDTTSYLELKYVKLEKGNKATDWSPAPEDINTEISNAETRSKSHAEDYTDAEITKIENGETVAQKANSLYDEDSGDWKIWKDVTNAVGDEVEEVLKQNNFATKDDIQSIIPSNATETGAGIVRAATQAEVNDGHVSDNDPSEMAFVRPETLQSKLDTSYPTIAVMTQAISESKEEVKGVVSAMDFPIEQVQGLKEALDEKLPLSGGTLTGEITAPSFKTNLTSGVAEAVMAYPVNISWSNDLNGETYLKAGMYQMSSVSNTLNQPCANGYGNVITVKGDAEVNKNNVGQIYLGNLAGNSKAYIRAGQAVEGGYHIFDSKWREVRFIDDLVTTSHIADTAITPAKIQTSIALNGTPSMTVEPTTSSPDKTIASVGLVKEVMEDIEIGGRNLIRNGDFLQGTEHWEDWNKTASFSVENGVATFTLNPSYPDILKTSVFEITNGQQYIVSLDVKSDDSTTLDYCYLMGVGVSNIYLGGIGGITSEWKRITYSFTATTTGSYCFGFGKKSGGSFQFRKVKIEKGNKATDWTPAPEDINTEISNAETRSKAHAEDYTDAEITKIENGETVAQKANSLYDEDSGDWKIWKDVTNAVGDEVEEVLKQNNFATKDDIQSIIPSNATETGAGIVRAATQAEVNDGHVSDNDPSEMAFVRPETLQSKLDTSYPTIAVMTQAISESKEEVKGVVSTMDFPIEHVQGLKEALEEKLPLSGGTLTGEITAPSFKTNLTSGVAEAVMAYPVNISWSNDLNSDTYLKAGMYQMSSKSSTLNQPSATGYGNVITVNSDTGTNKTNAGQIYLDSDGISSKAYIRAGQVLSEAAAGYHITDKTWREVRFIDELVTTSHIATAAITPAKIQTSIALNGTPSMTVEPTTSSPDKTIASVGLVKEVMEDIEIGGRNLILNGDFSRGVEHWINVYWGTTISSEENILRVDIKQSANQFGVNTSPISLESGQQYIMSFDVKSDGITSLDYCYLRSSSGNIRLSSINGITSEWQRLECKFTAMQTGIYNFSFGSYNLSTEISQSIEFRKVKIEKGNKATDWTPAPEDINTEISNAETRSKSHAEDYTDAEITKIENGETVAQKANSLYDEDSGDWKIWKDVTNAVGDEVEEVLKQNNFATKDDIQSIIPSNATETGAGIVRAATQAEVNDGHVSDNDPSEMAFVRPETLDSYIDSKGFATTSDISSAVTSAKPAIFFQAAQPAGGKDGDIWIIP